MARRAIILVPGFGHKEHNQARDRLVRALQNYTTGWRVEQTDDGVGPGNGAIGLHATCRCGGTTQEIDVYEAYWGDLLPDWSNESPWARFKRGYMLIRYWLTGGVGGWISRREAPPNTAWAMLLAAVALVLWWIVVGIFVLQAVESGVIAIPESLASIAWVQTAWTTLTGWTGTVRGSVLVVLLLWVWSLGWLERFANISAYTKAYLRDEVFGDDDVGLRAKAKRRVLEVLDRAAGITGPDRYDEIYVVGHSLGGAIAADALSESGDVLAHTVLFTWGSALGLLVQQEPMVEVRIATFYTAAPPVQGWIDVVLPWDMMGSQVPVPRCFDDASEPGRRHPPKFPDAVRPRLPRGTHPFEVVRVHEAYYRCEAALLMLVAPESTLPRRAAQAAVSAAPPAPKGRPA